LAQHVPVNATALIRGMFHRQLGQSAARHGRAFPPDWLETSFLPAALRKVTSGRALQSFSLQYGEPMGDSGLRQALSQKLAGHTTCRPRPGRS
jgi:DNA-binding transcriptional MocR family regulator